MLCGRGQATDAGEVLDDGFNGGPHPLTLPPNAERNSRSWSKAEYESPIAGWKGKAK
jgi:hypothetical protein